MTPAELRRFALDLVGRMDSGVVTVFAPYEGRVGFVVATTPSARSHGLSAHGLAPVLGEAVGGKGGGTAEVAQGSGTRSSGIAAAIGVVRQEVTRIE
jgi:alanyl-tRNA synthetase